ncbi:MAG: peptidase [Acidimicrobiia bacterium]|nr:peptidase [Acidimicrobiia bacterium]
MVSESEWGPGDGERQPPEREDVPTLDMILGEEFVRAATRHEPSAADRERAAASRFSAPPPRPKRAGRTGRSGRRATVPGLVLVVVLGLFAWSELGGSTGGGPSAIAGHQLGWRTTGDRPSPQRSLNDVPLGTPAEAPTVGGAYAFTGTQDDGRQPVAYDPCRPIPVVLNNRTAPPGGLDLVTEALAEVSRATGLRFVVEGTTGETPVALRDAYQPERYGDRWAPVLIAWSDARELPELGGDVAGIGGSTWVSTRGGPDVYVTGIVALDGPTLAQYRPSIIRGTILHELGHLVGLAHVDDRSQLMYHGNEANVITFGPGDRAGLARLGSGACVAVL